MTVEELETEVCRLRDVLARKDEEARDIAKRIRALDGQHADLLRSVDEVGEDQRAMRKSLRWLLAKARGEEPDL